MENAKSGGIGAKKLTKLAKKLALLAKNIVKQVLLDPTMVWKIIDPKIQTHSHVGYPCG